MILFLVFLAGLGWIMRQNTEKNAKKWAIRLAPVRAIGRRVRDDVRAVRRDVQVWRATRRRRGWTDERPDWLQ